MPNHRDMFPDIRSIPETTDNFYFSLLFFFGFDLSILKYNPCSYYFGFDLSILKYNPCSYCFGFDGATDVTHPTQ